ncbi:MAG: winged helix DNA-binding protein [Candidatus Thorarchaeota archaeon]
MKEGCYNPGRVQMPNKVLQIATLGLHANQRVDRVLVEKGANKLVLVCTQNNLEDVAEISGRHSRLGFPIEQILVEPWDYEAILSSVLKVVIDHPGYDVIFNISCGTTAMRAACHMASILIGAPVCFITEEEGQIVKNLVEVKPLSPRTLTPVKAKILETLTRSGGSVKKQRDLCRLVDLGTSSISKHIKQLEREGYVRVSRERGRHSIEITQLGETVLQLKKARRMRAWSK